MEKRKRAGQEAAWKETAVLMRNGEQNQEEGIQQWEQELGAADRKEGWDCQREGRHVVQRGW